VLVSYWLCADSSCVKRDSRRSCQCIECELPPRLIPPFQFLLQLLSKLARDGITELLPLAPRYESISLKPARSI
jgi:hypothetical protein